MFINKLQNAAVAFMFAVISAGLYVSAAVPASPVA